MVNPYAFDPIKLEPLKLEEQTPPVAGRWVWRVHLFLLVVQVVLIAIQLFEMWLAHTWLYAPMVDVSRRSELQFEGFATQQYPLFSYVLPASLQLLVCPALLHLPCHSSYTRKQCLGFVAVSILSFLVVIVLAINAMLLDMQARS